MRSASPDKSCRAREQGLPLSLRQSPTRLVPRRVTAFGQAADNGIPSWARFAGSFYPHRVPYLEGCRVPITALEHEKSSNERPLFLNAKQCSILTAHGKSPYENRGGAL